MPRRDQSFGETLVGPPPVQSGQNTDRSRLPGKQDMDRLGKGIYENVDSTYDIEEKKLIESNIEIRRLVENLEQNEDANKDKT